MSQTELALDVIRKKVFFHNSVDVWISACEEKNIEWNNTESYKKFISYLLKNNLQLKAFNLCAHEAGAVEEEKTKWSKCSWPEMYRQVPLYASIYFFRHSNVRLHFFALISAFFYYRLQKTNQASVIFGLIGIGIGIDRKSESEYDIWIVS